MSALLLFSWSLIFCAASRQYQYEEEFASAGVKLNHKDKTFSKTTTIEEVLSDAMGDVVLYSILSELSRDHPEDFDDYSFLDPAPWLQDGSLSVQPDPENPALKAIYSRPLFPKDVATQDIRIFAGQYELTDKNVREYAIISLIDFLFENYDRSATTIKPPNPNNMMWYKHPNNGDKDKLLHATMLPIDNGWAAPIGTLETQWRQGVGYNHESETFDDEHPVIQGAVKLVYALHAANIWVVQAAVRRAFRGYLQKIERNSKTLASDFWKENTGWFDHMQTLQDLKSSEYYPTLFYSTWLKYAKFIAKRVQELSEQHFSEFMKEIVPAAGEEQKKHCESMKKLVVENAERLQGATAFQTNSAKYAGVSDYYSDYFDANDDQGSRLYRLFRDIKELQSLAVEQAD